MVKVEPVLDPKTKKFIPGKFHIAFYPRPVSKRRMLHTRFLTLGLALDHAGISHTKVPESGRRKTLSGIMSKLLGLAK